jgi:hypothetical protein
MGQAQQTIESPAASCRFPVAEQLPLPLPAPYPSCAAHDLVIGTPAAAAGISSIFYPASDLVTAAPPMQVLYLGTPSTSGYMTSRLAPPPCVSGAPPAFARAYASDPNTSTRRRGRRLFALSFHAVGLLSHARLHSVHIRPPSNPSPPTLRRRPAYLTSTPSPNSPTTQQRCRSSVM